MAGRDVERAFVARAEEPMLIGLGDDGTRAVRALLAGGREGRSIEGYAKTHVIAYRR
jgi:hypothetical protein